MKTQIPFPIARINLLPKFVLSPLLTVALFAIGNIVFAQGTATGPSTAHNVDPGLIVFVGDASSPIPIDLDPTGPSWTKGFFDVSGFSSGGGTLDIFETIQNVGTEAWGDWHAHILGDPSSASVPSFWSSVTGLEVNGSPITFTATGVGTKNLWLDNFSQPVLPGNILTINKQIDVFSNTAGADGVSLVRLEQFPTPATIPEPGSFALALVGLAAFGLLRSKRVGALN